MTTRRLRQSRNAGSVVARPRKDGTDAYMLKWSNQTWTHRRGPLREAQRYLPAFVAEAMVAKAQAPRASTPAQRATHVCPMVRDVPPRSRHTRRRQARDTRRLHERAKAHPPSPARLLQAARDHAGPCATDAQGTTRGRLRGLDCETRSRRSKARARRGQEDGHLLHENSNPVPHNSRSSSFPNWKAPRIMPSGELHNFPGRGAVERLP